MATKNNDLCQFGTRIERRHAKHLQQLKNEHGVCQSVVIRRLLDFYFDGNKVPGLPATTRKK